VAVVRPLRLKTEVVSRNDNVSAGYLPVVRVWVDNGVYHLDGSYDYLVPQSLSPLISVGVRVEVPFNSRTVEAIVLERLPESESAKLKYIVKVISPIPVATQLSLALIAAVSKRWAAHPYDVIRSAIPPRAASVEKELFEPSRAKIKISKPSRSYLQLPPFAQESGIIAEHIKACSTDGRVLVIVPESRFVDQICNLYPGAISIDSSLDRTTRYRNFLKAVHGSADIFVGTRSAIFAPIPGLTRIVVADEGSENSYERRSPGWNVRDVAILRSQIEKVSLDFVGYSPSSEISRLIELKWITYSAVRNRVSVQNFPQSTSELLPGRIISEVRKALQKGPVLFIASRKGYSQALSCARCRNVAQCECGGRLFKSSPNSKPECALCGVVQDPWSCTWCQGVTPFLIGRGSARFAQEIGSAFPGNQITVSEGDHILDGYEKSDGIVIATPGSMPIAPHGYSAVVILEGDSYFAQSDIRSQERTRELFFSCGGLMSKDGALLLVIANENSIIGALSSWKPSLLAQRELRERQEVHLPPYVRALSLDIAAGEVNQLIRGLEIARDEKRLPVDSRILGPVQLKGSLSRVLIMAPIDDGEALITFIHEYQRRRSAAKKTLATLRIDPYSLTR
jgi:primosomal protein N' (replication factor Y)